MNRKLKRTIITVISVVLLALCLSVSVTASKNNVGTVSKLKSAVTATSVTLKWSKAKNAKGYQISVKSGKKWKTVATVTSTTCKINGLKAGTKYTYRVKAYGKNGKKKVWAKKTKDISVLTAPKNVSSLKATVSGTTATLKWKKTSGAKGYKVYQYNPSKKKWTEIQSTTSLKATVKKLSAGKTYQFAVKAYAKSGKTTLLSSSYSKANVTVSPENISNLKITGTSVDTISLSWSKAKGASAYAVYQYNTKNGKWTTLISSTKTTTVTIGKLSPDTSYIFGVRALTKPEKKPYYSSKYVQITAVTDKKGAIPSTKAEIAAAYNKAVNNFKAYKGHVTMLRQEKNEIAYNNLPAVAVTLLNKTFKTYLADVDETYIFRNGTDSTASSIKITDKVVPCSRNASVTAADLSAATVKKNSDGGYTMTLLFPTEKIVYENSAYVKQPSKIVKATDYLDLNAIDLGPISIISCDTECRGTTVKATVDSKGRLTSLESSSITYGNWKCKAGIAVNLPALFSSAAKYTMNYDSNTAIRPDTSLTVPVYTTFPTTNAPQTTADPTLTAPTAETTAVNIDNSTTTILSLQPVSLTVNSYGYGNGVIYVEVDPSNWDGNFVSATRNIIVKVNGTALATTATCSVPSKKTGNVYEIKITLPSQSIKSGDVVSFTIPTGIVKNETGTQYNLSYSSSVTV